jgi:hypothetical protein
VNERGRTDEARVRAALEQLLLAEAPPLPERFVGGVMRAGRRQLSRRRARLAAAGGVLSAAALAVTAVALPALRDLDSDGWRPVGQSSPGAQDRQAAFRRQVAGVLEDLLPWPGQRVAVLPRSINAYRVTASAGTFAITFRVDRPIPGVSTPVTTCEEDSGENASAGYVSCRTGTLPDGRTVAAVHQVDGLDGFHVTVGNPISTFRYRNADVMLALFGDDATMTPVPITDAQVLAVVTNPRFLELVDYWAANLMDPPGATAQPTAPTTPTAEPTPATT